MVQLAIIVVGLAAMAVLAVEQDSLTHPLILLAVVVGQQIKVMGAVLMVTATHGRVAQAEALEA